MKLRLNKEERLELKRYKLSHQKKDFKIPFIKWIVIHCKDSAELSYHKIEKRKIIYSECFCGVRR